MPDRIALQPLAGRRIYFEAQVVRNAPGRDNVRRLRGVPHLCLKPVEINGRALPQEPDGREPMHLWVALPTAVIDLSDQCPQALGVRGFGTVMLYRRDNGSVAYGLGHAGDLEVQCGESEGWSVLEGIGPRHLPSSAPAYGAAPPGTALAQFQAWRTYFTPKVQWAHRKIVVYRHRSDDPHHRSYCDVLNVAWETVRAGHLPEAIEMNTVYFLMGQWPARQAPRHLREAYP